MKKTTLSDIIKNINFNDKNIQDDVAWEDLINTLNIEGYPYWFKQERLKPYFIQKWYCTVPYVGTRLYFLDGEFVALSNQYGRKMDEDFEFKDIESANKVRDYILTLMKEESEPLNLKLIDENAEWDEFHTIEYNTQILHNSAYYNGEKVSIVKNNFTKEGIHSPNYFHSVLIKLQDGSEVIVDCRELLFSRFSLD